MLHAIRLHLKVVARFIRGKRRADGTNSGVFLRLATSEQRIFAMPQPLGLDHLEVLCGDTADCRCAVDAGGWWTNVELGLCLQPRHHGHEDVGNGAAKLLESIHESWLIKLAGSFRGNSAREPALSCRLLSLWPFVVQVHIDLRVAHRS